ncbi:hypothetical protein [Sphaerisporangium dianthi]|uniref:DUF4352 domain-containing protein n=1 Tax=Sphaerisporangium dianthi TaxID=1436120 RepID=A0ABV9CBL6_9ACTN
MAAVIGIALAIGAVCLQTFVMTADEKAAPLTVSGGKGEILASDHFSARLEQIEFARSVRVKRTYTTDEVATDQIFLVVKVGATTPRRPIKLVPYLVTADGLRFNATDKINETATLTDKWIQTGWWRSGLCFFEIPPGKVAGARVVVTEQQVNSLYDDQYLPEVSLDLGLDQARAREAMNAAKDVYEASGR